LPFRQRTTPQPNRGYHATSNYCGISGSNQESGNGLGAANNGGMFYQNSSIRIAMITDGTSNTAMIGNER